MNQTRQLTVTVNEYMDLILKEVTEYAQANNLDPTELADIETGFSQVSDVQFINSQSSKKPFIIPSWCPHPSHS